MNQTSMTLRWPLFFHFTAPIFGKGFIAGVTCRGRMLAERCGDEMCLFGVNPGPVAASGATLEEAHAELRHTLTTVLADIAAEAPGFTEFRREVTAFFETPAEETERAWKDAVARARSGERPVEDLGLLTEPAEQMARIQVVELQPSPAANETILETPTLKTAA